MKIINPKGSKHINITDGESLIIELEDFDPGDRSFELTVCLKGNQSHCHIKGRIQSQKKEHKHWNILIEFQGFSQQGSVDIRGIAEQESLIRAESSAVIAHKSSAAVAHIQEKVLLFDQAKALLIPVLTVETDEVESASHSASATPINPEIILYLESRGFNRKEAVQEIKSGFLK